MNDDSFSAPKYSSEINLSNSLLRQSYYSPKISTIKHQYSDKAILKNNPFTGQKLHTYQTKMPLSSQIDDCTCSTVMTTTSKIIVDEKEKSSAEIKTEIDIGIEIDDMIILENKLEEILSTLRNLKSADQVCYEWWRITCECGYHDKIFCFFLKAFKGNENMRKLLHECTIIEFLAIAICYDSCKDKSILASTVKLLASIFYLILQNFVIICDIILNCFSEECCSNLWYRKLQSLITGKISGKIKKGEHFILLKSNNDSININLKNFFRTIPSENTNFNKLHQAYQNFNRISIYMINEIFKESSQSHLKAQSSSSSPNNSISTEGIPSVTVPYLLTPLSKDFSLVMDLDETIVQVQFESASSTDPVINVRPFLFEFIEECSKYYEIIMFTASHQDYADEIVDYLERQAGKILFEHRLYRQHASDMTGEYVKDLSKIGRQLSKIIIVDNTRKNFKLQQDNGILIKSFKASVDDKPDTILNELSEILISIAQSNPCDIRRALAEHKEEILKKVSCI